MGEGGRRTVLTPFTIHQLTNSALDEKHTTHPRVYKHLVPNFEKMILYNTTHRDIVPNKTGKHSHLKPFPNRRGNFSRLL